MKIIKIPITEQNREVYWSRNKDKKAWEKLMSECPSMTSKEFWNNEWEEFDKEEICLNLNKIQDMERLNFETLFRIVRWDYNRCFKDESLDKDLFMGKYGKVMGEHYYNKFIHEFDGNILKMIGYFRGSEKEGQVFCDMITERIEKYEKRMSYDKGKLNN